MTTRRYAPPLPVSPELEVLKRARDDLAAVLREMDGQIRTIETCQRNRMVRVEVAAKAEWEAQRNGGYADTRERDLTMFREKRENPKLTHKALGEKYSLSAKYVAHCLFRGERIAQRNGEGNGRCP